MSDSWCLIRPGRAYCPGKSSPASAIETTTWWDYVSACGDALLTLFPYNVLDTTQSGTTVGTGILVRRLSGRKRGNEGGRSDANAWWSDRGCVRLVNTAGRWRQERHTAIIRNTALIQRPSHELWTGFEDLSNKQKKWIFQEGLQSFREVFTCFKTVFTCTGYLVTSHLQNSSSYIFFMNFCFMSSSKISASWNIMLWPTRTKWNWQASVKDDFHITHYGMLVFTWRSFRPA